MQYLLMWWHVVPYYNLLLSLFFENHYFLDIRPGFKRTGLCKLVEITRILGLR